jgi:hypothetical protein
MMLGVFIGRHSRETSSGRVAEDTTGANATEQNAAPPRVSAQAKAHVASGRTESKAPLPPPGTPLKAMIAELRARADAGDADAASRLYRDMQRCAERHQILATMPAIATRILDEKLERLSPTEMKGRDSMLGTVQSGLQFANENAALCEGISDDQLESVVPAVLRAAQLGDDDAADCYAGSELGNHPGLLDHPEWISDFKDNAVDVANNAVQHGDWIAVRLLALAYKGTFYGSLLGQATGADPALAYRYLRLWRLGASTKDNVDFIDKQLAQAAKQIPQSTLDDAEHWAQDAHQRYFAKNPQSTAGSNINICHRGEP